MGAAHSGDLKNAWMDLHGGIAGKQSLSKEEQIAMGQRSPSPRPRQRPSEHPEAVDEWRTEWSEKFGEWYWWHEKTMQVSW
jgi:hypothetical protein